MKIEQNKVVYITYTLRNGSAEGEIVETVTAEKPLEFIFGKGFLLPAFEENLKDLSIGDDFSFTLDEKNAYGERNDQMVIPLEKKLFQKEDGSIEEGLLEIGNPIPMQDTQGRQLMGRVVELQDDKVIMDFNHPMAGQTLHFTGKVENLREATEEELNPPQHDGCGCGSEHGGCDEGGCGDDHGHEHGGGCGCH